MVGTAEGCDVRVSEAPYLSNRHFAICRHDDGLVTVEDLGSTNGTEVYNPMVGWVRARSPIAIGPGSKIHAGRLLFKIDDAGRVNVQRDVSILDRDRA